MQTKLFISSLLLLLFFTGCLNDKGILPSHFFEQTSCADTDTVGVWQYVGLDGEDIISIAIHPDKPHEIFAGSFKDFSAGETGKLYLSTDCGKTWRIILEGENFKITTYDPHNPDIIYTSPAALVKSINGGLYWSNISKGITLNWETFISTFQIDPFNSNTLYAGTSGFYGGDLYRSKDAGKNWTIISEKYIGESISCISIDPTNSSILYAANDVAVSLFKSTDFGNTWDTTGLANVGYIIYELLINPYDSQHLIAASSGLYQSKDGGDTWSSFNEGLPGTFLSTNLCFDTVSKDFYCNVTNNDSSAIFKRNIDDFKWKKIGMDTLNISSYYSELLISPDNRYLYYGTQKKGLYRMKLR